MLYHKPVSYYFSSLSNLLAAFGGGLILGKGVGIIDFPYIQGGSILAFFIGTILGLVFLQCIPKKYSALFFKSFSIICGIVSLILLYIYHHYAYQGQIKETPALLFFILLSLRFGLWFYSRVMRASQASANHQSLAGVEFGYYAGMVFGLVIWKLSGITIALGTALLIDAIFQFIAGSLDLKTVTLEKLTVALSKKKTPLFLESQHIPCSIAGCWKLASAVVVITVGVQVIIFNTAHYVSEIISSYMLAAFYLGVAMAAFVCNKNNVYIFWDETSNAVFIALHAKKIIKMKGVLLISLLALSVTAIISTINLYSFTNPALLHTLSVCSMVLIAAFIFEVLSLALLDRIGYEEKKLNSSGLIMKTYGLMGLSAAIGFWILSILPNHFTASVTALSICLSFAAISIVKNPIKSRRFINRFTKAKSEII